MFCSNKKNQISIKKTVQEECGLLGVYSTKPDRLFTSALTAAQGVQHRGQHGVGLAQFNGEKIQIHKQEGLLKELLVPEIKTRFNSDSVWTLVHCRYGTHGSYQDSNLQPCFSQTKTGENIAVIHNGQFTGIKHLKSIIDQNSSTKLKQGTSDTLLFTKVLTLSPGTYWDEKIINCLQNVTGAYSLLIGIKDTLYAARDSLGLRPLFLGQLLDKRWLIASETQTFSKIGAELLREVTPGEIIKLDRTGLQILKSGGDSRKHFCDFELAYFSRPDSSYQQGSFASFRERCGALLSKQATSKNASFVVGIPDSGIAVATGYAQAANISYRQLIIRDHHDTDGNRRLFMQDNRMDQIENRVTGKLSIIPDREIWKDSIVVLGDDSIVRGNVSRKITALLREWQVKEVHWIIGFPPVTTTCHLGVSIRTNGELIAAKYGGDSNKIAKAIGADSIEYITPENFLQAKYPNKKLDRPENKKELFLQNGGCGGCTTGLYPLNKKGEYYYE